MNIEQIMALADGYHGLFNGPPAIRNQARDNLESALREALQPQEKPPESFMHDCTLRLRDGDGPLFTVTTIAGHEVVLAHLRGYDIRPVENVVQPVAVQPTE